MLGDRFTYPFSVQKLDSINYTLGNTSPLPITHKYVQFTASTAAEFKDIKEDNRFVTSHHPYDYELLQEGKKLQGYENALIYPLYAVIPTNIDITNYSFVVLEDVHFEPSETLLNKLAYKDYLESIGDEPCEPGASIYPLCQCDQLYTYGSPAWINCILDEGFVDPVPNATNSQLACNCATLNTRWPSGCVTYDDTQFAQPQPVKNLQVRGVNQFGFYFIEYTDQNGCWQANRQLEWWESMRLKLKFNNEKVAIRSLFSIELTPNLAILDVEGFSNIVTDEHFFPYNSAVNNIPVHYIDSPQPFIEQKRLYLAALTLNSMEEYHQYADHYNIQKPSIDGLFSDDIDVLITNLNRVSGAAPMLDEIGGGLITPFDQNNGYAPIINAIMGLDIVTQALPNEITVLGQVIPIFPATILALDVLEDVFTYLSNLVDIYAFDVVMNYGDDDIIATDRIKRVIYHEFAHVAYYQRLPQNTRNQFWIDNIDYIANNILLDMNDPMGLAGNEPYGNFNFVGAQRTAINEAWAEHVGRLFADRRYDLEHSINIAFPAEDNTHRIVLERFAPNPIDPGNGTFRWIPEGLFLDLVDDDDTFEPPNIVFNGMTTTLIDEVSGFSHSEIEAIISDNTPETFIELRTNILTSTSAFSNSTTFLTLLCDQYGI